MTIEDSKDRLMPGGGEPGTFASRVPEKKPRSLLLSRLLQTHSPPSFGKGLGE